MGEVPGLGQHALNAARNPKGLGHYSSQPIRRRVGFMGSLSTILHCLSWRCLGVGIQRTGRGRASGKVSAISEHILLSFYR